MRNNYLKKKLLQIVFMMVAVASWSSGLMAQTNYYINEKFNATTLPSTWTVIDGGDPGTPTWDSRVNIFGFYTLRDGTRFAGAFTNFGNAKHDEQLISPTFNVQSGSNLFLRYDEIFYSYNVGSVLQIFDGNDWVTLVAYQQLQQIGGAGGAQTFKRFIDLTPYAGPNLRLRWHYKGDVDYFGWYYGWWGIDNVEVYSIDKDLEPVKVDYPSPCGFTARTPISITVRNNGNQTVDPALFSLFVYDPDGNLVPGGATVINAGRLEGGQGKIINRNVNLASSGYGAYKITVVALLTGDEVPQNDRLEVEAVSYKPYDLRDGDYIQPFTGVSSPGAARQKILNEWTFVPYTDQKKLIQNSFLQFDPAPIHFSPFNNNANYIDRIMVYSAYNVNRPMNDWLFSPCIYLEQGTFYDISIDALNPYGGYGTLYHEDISLWAGFSPTPSAMTTPIMSPILFARTTFNFTQYQRNNVRFFATESGYYNFGIYFKKQPPVYWYYIFLDNFSVKRLPKTDLAVTRIMNSCIGKTAKFRVELQNNGSFPASDFDVSYRIRPIPTTANPNPVWSATYTERFTRDVPPFGLTEVFEFQNSDYFFLRPGEFEIQVTANVVGDENPANNTLSTRIESIERVALNASNGFRYEDGFETGGMGWTTSIMREDVNIFSTTPLTNTTPNLWAIGSPCETFVTGCRQKPTPAFRRAASGDQAWFLDPRGNMTTNGFSGYVNCKHTFSSPNFDLSNMKNPVMQFDYFARLRDYFGSFYEGVYMQVSTNCGESWEIFNGLDYGAREWYNINTQFTAPFERGWGGRFMTDWKSTGYLDLSRFAGEPNFRVRFVYLAPNSFFYVQGAIDGFGMDNFVIREKPENNIAVNRVLTEYGCEGSNIYVTAELQNYGSKAQNNFAISFSVNGRTERTELFQERLAAGERKIFRFLAPYRLRGSDNIIIEVNADLPGDEDLENNTASIEMPVGRIFSFRPSLSIDKDLAQIENFNDEGWTSTPNNPQFTFQIVNRLPYSLPYGWRNSPTNFITSPNFSNQRPQVNWYSWSGARPSFGSGPANLSPGNIPGRYLLLYANNAPYGTKSTVYAPCIDLNNPQLPDRTYPALNFKYHMYQTFNSATVVPQMGKIELQASVEGSDYQTIWESPNFTLRPANIPANGGTTLDANNDRVMDAVNPENINVDLWKQVSISLSKEYNGLSLKNKVVSFRFVGTIGSIRVGNSGGYSDMAIDDITVGRMYDKDLRAVSARLQNRPGNQGCLSEENIQVFIANDGYEGQENFNMGYKVDGTHYRRQLATQTFTFEAQPPVTLPLYVGPNSTVRTPFTFSGPATYSFLNNTNAPITHTVQVFPELGNDRRIYVVDELGTVIHNDTTTFQVISYPTPLRPVVTRSLANSFCEFDAGITLRVNDFDDSKFDYQWFKNEEPILGENGETLNLEMIRGAIGSYTVRITNKQYGCSATSKPFFLDVYSLPITEISVDGFVLTANVTSISRNIQSYTWMMETPRGLRVLATSQTQSWWIAREAGRYRVAVVDEAGCRDTSETVTVTATAIEDELYSQEVSVYPNPSTGIFKISVDKKLEGNAGIKVTDISGKQLSSIVVSSQQLRAGYELDLSNVASGVYTIQITTGSSTITKRIIKTGSGN